MQTQKVMKKRTMGIQSACSGLTQRREEEGSASRSLRPLTGDGNSMGVLKHGTVRKLTPRECFRLFGVEEEVIDRLIDSGISDTQLYAAAGDSVVIPVVYEIAKKMISEWEKSNNGNKEETSRGKDTVSP